MSDVFNLPLRVHAGSVMCQGVVYPNKPNPELCMRGINYTGDEVKLAQYTAFAINNHDQMTSKIISMQGEIAELRDFLARVATCEIETLNFEIGDSGDTDCIEYVCTDIVEEANELLAKHK